MSNQENDNEIVGDEVYGGGEVVVYRAGAEIGGGGGGEDVVYGDGGATADARMIIYVWVEIRSRYFIWVLVGSRGLLMGLLVEVRRCFMGVLLMGGRRFLMWNLVERWLPLVIVDEDGGEGNDDVDGDGGFLEIIEVDDDCEAVVEGEVGQDDDGVHEEGGDGEDVNGEEPVIQGDPEIVLAEGVNNANLGDHIAYQEVSIGIDADAGEGEDNCCVFARTIIEPYVNKLEVVLNLTALLSTMVSIFTMAFPGEKGKGSDVRANLITYLGVALLVCYVIRIVLDHHIDRASCLYYDSRRRNGEKEFYWKGLTHIFGLFVIVVALTMAVIQYLKTVEHDLNATYIYWFSVGSNIITGINYLVQNFRLIKKGATVRRVDEEHVYSRRVRETANIPPRGRTVFYEAHPGYGEVDLV